MGNHWRASSEVYHERAKEYDSWFDNSLLFSIEKAAISSLPLPLQHPSLEIGVGPGRFAHAMGSEFGIDPALAPLQIARARGVAGCQAVGEALPFCGSSFARVSLFFTLCFVQDPSAVLRESHRVLQEKGHLVLGFVPATSKWGINLQKKKEAGNPFYEYAHFFTIEEVETLLADQGFLQIASVSSLYQAPGKVSQMESPQLGLDEKAGFVALATTKISPAIT